MLTRKERFIGALDALTRDWVYDKNLFCGGCAYAAAILARELEKMGFKYEVVTYNYMKKNVIKSNESCAHLAIRVKIAGKNFYIGGEFTGGWFCDRRHTSLGMIPSEEIMRYYKNIKRKDEWNDWYDVSYNATFSRLCNNIYKKFAVTECGK